MASEDRDFRRGYYLAVTNLLRMNDQPSMAAELLAEYGPLDLSGIDEYDAAVLRRLVKAEPRHFRRAVTPSPEARDERRE